VINSLRWKLMAWYAVIVAAMTVVFGTLTQVNVRRSIERELDDRLREQATALAEVLVPEENGKFRIELLPEQMERFQHEEADSYYYRIWNSRRILVDTSYPEMTLPYPQSLGSRSRDTRREVIIHGPAGSRILVGRGMQQEQAQLSTLAGTCVAVGLIVLVPLLAGGWFLTSRALAPIEHISKAAAAISASQRAERIDVSRMEAELADLALTVNDAFDRLQQALDRQARFTADASHELRTPLSVIMARTELALKCERSPDEYRDTLSIVRHAAARMKAVVEGLLTLARADSGNVPLECETCRLRPIVEETCRLLQALVDQKQLTMVCRLEPLSVAGDRARISDAVLNLLCNAIQHNQLGGRIEVQLYAEGDQAVIEVSNTGPGIPEAQQPYVFDRFYRVDESRSAGSGGGSGLGLAITKWIAEAHGGSVALTSREGQRTTVVMRLPGERESRK
jgi:two-component system, OmpR family, sensor kinase